MFHEELDVEHWLHEILRLLEEILHILKPKARSATLTYFNSQGVPSNMPQTVHLSDAPGSYLFQEFSGPNGTGTIVPPTGAVSYASDNAAVATVDATTGQLAYLSVGTANISGTDAGNSLTASDALTIIAPVAVSATMTFEAPKGSAAAAALKKA